MILQSNSLEITDPMQEYLLEDYIDNHISAEPEYLKKLDRDTHIHLVNPRMCSGHLQGRLLKMITGMIRPKKTLEIGTFSGYSALCIAEGMPEEGILHTIEIDDELEEFIKNHIALAPTHISKKIRLHIGDAKEIIPDLGEDFDMIFVDADKREYENYYRMLKPIVNHGGYILADNTLWDGHIAEKERHDSQTEGIRRFNKLISNDQDVEKVIIPIRDGLTLIRKF